jgi:hypothetical protein
MEGDNPLAIWAIEITTVQGLEFGDASPEAGSCQVAAG